MCRKLEEIIAVYAGLGTFTLLMVATVRESRGVWENMYFSASIMECQYFSSQGGYYQEVHRVFIHKPKFLDSFFFSNDFLLENVYKGLAWQNI